MRVISALCFLFLFAIATPANAGDMEDCRADSANASTVCQKLIDSHRYKGRALLGLYNSLGVAYNRRSENEEAIKAFSHALSLDARYTLARTNRALCLAAIGRYPDAVSDMTAAIKLAPTATNYALRADYHERNNELDLALKDYATAIKKQPRVASYYANRGHILSALSRHTDAIEDYSRAIQLNARNPSLYFYRGVAWTDAGKCDQAIPDYTKAIELSPRFANAYNNRGVCFRRAGKLADALRDYESAVKYEPGNQTARRNLAATKAAVPPLKPPPVVAPKFDLPPVNALLNVPEFPLKNEQKK